ncbi:hypothetical protein [uncultured Jannaschia sp.]|uniref:hypothetical protein n=1 Tax=uncultured Jannaschia sp. TaxID=293347 RepID=UPI0026026453|nr:hypothetical protein [uncultured Jannaschia sp.]
MANNSGDFRNPKISDTGTKSSGGIGKWIGIAIAGLVVLLLLLWLLGAFGSDDADVDMTDPDAVTAPTN